MADGACDTKVMEIIREVKVPLLIYHQRHAFYITLSETILVNGSIITNTVGVLQQRHLHIRGYITGNKFKYDFFLPEM